MINTEFDSFDELFSENDRVREELISLVKPLTAAQGELRSEKGGWSIKEIVEHILKVEVGVTRIAASLLKKAEEEGKKFQGAVEISDGFTSAIKRKRNEKFQAPEMVHPSGEKTIAESLPMLESAREALKNLRPKFDTVESTQYTFPHPAFGELSALDWLVLVGGHETRHMSQIERILDNQE